MKFNDLKLKSQIISANAIILTVMIFISIFVYIEINRMVSTQYWVTHTHEVINSVEEVMLEMLNMETGMRGYLVTGKKEFLAPYKSGVENLEATIDKLKQLVSDSNSESARVEIIREKAHEWKQDIAKTALKLRDDINVAEKLTKAGKNNTDVADARNSLLAFMVKGYGKTIMDNIRLKVDEFIKTEKNLLQQRSQEATAIAHQTVYVVILGTLLALILGTLITLYLSRKILELIGGEPRNIAKIAKSIAAGNLAHEFNNENKLANSIYSSLHAIVASFREMVSQTKSIATGNYNTEVIVRSEQDELSTALATMKNKLQDVSISNEKQIWQANSIAKVSDLSQGSDSIDSLCEAVISELATQLAAGHGAIYIYKLNNDNDNDNDNDIVLHLSGSYAFSQRKSVAGTINTGSGLVGQCAKEGKAILLSNIPSDYIAIKSALGEKQPLNIYVFPLIFDGNVLGVVELASFNEISQEQQKMLQLASENISTAINTLQSIEKTKKLLTTTKEQSKELKNQQAQLQESNKTLAEQAESLKASEEELRVANEELAEKAEILQKSEDELRAQSEELRVSNDELVKKSEKLQIQQKAIEKNSLELEEKAKALEVSGQYKSDFLANMSHELRTPLNSLLILSNALAKNSEGNLTAEQVEHAEIIHSGGNELLMLINDILDLSKVEAGKLNIISEDVLFKDIENNLNRQFTPLAKSKSLEFNVKIASSCPNGITTDGQRVEQILKNMLSNAFKFTASGSVDVEINKPNNNITFNNPGLSTDTAVQFSVQDSGIGISKAKQDAIFEAFQQEDGSTSREYGGTGLGLTISKELAKLLGGEIQLESEEGKGSKFSLFLPITAISAKNANETVQPEIAELAPTPEQAVQDVVFHDDKCLETYFIADDRKSLTAADKSILIIEDDKTFAKILMSLAQKKGYKVVVAGDGHSGLVYATNYKPNAILLDLGLPDINGLEVLEQLKHSSALRQIPVHIISAADDVAKTLKKGAIGFLTKPASTDDIDKIFAKLESISKSQLKNILVVEDDAGNQAAIESLIANDNINVTAVSSGAEAIRIFNNKTFDTVILDLHLPDMKGKELLRTLRDDHKIKLPPVIIYTGTDLSLAEVNELNEYTSNIVVKGVNSPERLLNEVTVFLHSVKESLPDMKVQILEDLYNKSNNLEGKRVLLVDDDMRNVYALSFELKNHGLEVIKAENGKVALEKLITEQSIDLVIMDIMMPVMDGYTAMKEIRKIEQHLSLPIIACTAKAMTGDKNKCLDAGATDYITKPIDINKLLSLMKILVVKNHG